MHSLQSDGSRHHLWHFLAPYQLSHLLCLFSTFYLVPWPIPVYVRCLVIVPDMHVLIVTYHASTPEAADAGPLLSGRVREKGRKELILWVKDAAHCLMRAISTAKGKVKVWHDALDDLVSFLACFYRTSSKRMRGLWRQGGEVLFLRSHWCVMGGSHIP